MPSERHFDSRVEPFDQGTDGASESLRRTIWHRPEKQIHWLFESFNFPSVSRLNCITRRAFSVGARLFRIAVGSPRQHLQRGLRLLIQSLIHAREIGYQITEIHHKKVFLNNP